MHKDFSSLFSEMQEVKSLEIDKIVSFSSMEFPSQDEEARRREGIAHRGLTVLII